jgi:hypothetical protein
MSSISEHEKQAWYRMWKFWAFVGYALVIVVICMCLFVSIQEIPIWSLVPDSAFAFISININDDQEGTASMLNGIESWMLQQESSRFRKFVIKRAFSFLPDRIIVIAAAGKETKPELLIIMKAGGVLRLANMFHGRMDRAIFEGQNVKNEKIRGHRISYVENTNGRMGIGAYSIIGKTLVAGSSYEILREGLTHYSINEYKKVDMQNIISVFLRGTEMYNFVLFADNGDGNLSKIVRHIEARYAFAPFPSMDAVEMVYGNMSLAEDELSGQITFRTNDISRQREVQSDVKYIYGAMRRMFKPMGINLEGEIQLEDSRVIFNFKIPDHITAMVDYLSEKQGELE